MIGEAAAETAETTGITGTVASAGGAGTVYALIPAAGRGARFGSAENKVFAPLLGRPLLGWTLQAFVDCAKVDEIILIGGAGDLRRLRGIGLLYGGGKVSAVVEGGATRQESVRLGLAAIPEYSDSKGSRRLILVHDAARPCVTPEIIARVIGVSRWIGGCGTAAMPIADTLRRQIYEGDTQPVPSVLNDEVSRRGIFAVQTPQGFHEPRFRFAHERAALNNWTFTDDTGLYQRANNDPCYVALGSAENIKVTLPEDLDLAEAILMRRMVVASLKPSPPSEKRRFSEGGEGLRAAIRVGHGYDVHPFAPPYPPRPLYLGGVLFPEAPQGLLGHSDADAVLHAVCDALLGAAALGDIGHLFPPTDARHKDRRSIEFLAEVKARLDERGWRVGNVDITVLAETPKILPRAGDIRQTIAVCLGIDADAVSVKATTNEGMGFVGRGEGIAAHATALLFR